MKRQRGRGRGKPGGHHHQPNRTLESSGPEIKVRGPAAHIYERYLNLARDASASGDRVMAENYLQHAEHYFRVLRAQQPAMPPPQPSSDRFGAADMDYEGDEEGGGEGGGDQEAGGEGGDQPDVEFPGAQQQQHQQQQQRPQGGGGDFERDGEFRRRRGRRNRYRGEGEGPREGGEGQREPREGGERQAGENRERQGGENREPRNGGRERAPRERDGERSEDAGPEGFSSGPKPAFLRQD